VTQRPDGAIVMESQHDARRLVGPPGNTCAPMTTLARDRSPAPLDRAAHGPHAVPDGHVPTPADCFDDGVLTIEGCGSLFLFDLVQRRFQRLPRGSDAARASRYGRWLPLHELVLDADGTFTVDPGDGAPILRSHVHGAGCPCERRALVS
jgi:hypothetical protein